MLLAEVVRYVDKQASTAVASDEDAMMALCRDFDVSHGLDPPFVARNLGRNRLSAIAEWLRCVLPMAHCNRTRQSNRLWF